MLVVISKFFAKLFHRHKLEDRPTIDGENSAY